jgi:hypothetical protein
MALIYKTINSDQVFKAQSLILAIHKVLTVAEPLVNKHGIVRIWLTRRPLRAYQDSHFFTLLD